MGIHVAVIGYLRLLAGGHSNWQILAALLFPFALKLPLVAARLPNSCAQLAVTLRFFVFRLRRIAICGRWERTLRRLRRLRGRVNGGDGRHLRVLRPSDEMLATISMLTL